MTEKVSMARDIADLYNRQAESFAARAGTLLWWKFIGMPSYDRRLPEFYNNKDVLVLDLGSGSARVPLYLVENGVPPQNITGVEISPELIARAKESLPNATFIEGDIASVELPPNHFDLVTSNMVFEFLSDKELKKTLENAFAALKDNGVLFYITTHPVKMQMDSGLETPGRFETVFPWGGRGPNYYRTLDDFRRLTQEAGFTIEALEELGIPEEAAEEDPAEYQRYAKYPYVRLVVKARKTTSSAR